MNTRDLALAAVLAALYALGCVLLAPISYWIFQVRVADALVPLSALFGWPAIFGVTVGGLVANFFTPVPLAWIDIVLGSIANFVASYLAWRVRKMHLFLSTVVANLAVTFIVGTYLPLLLGFPIYMGWLGVFLGSLIAMNLIGYMLMKALQAAGALEALGYGRKAK